MSKKHLSLAEAAVKVLRDAGKPLHYRDICQQILEQGLVELTSKTPAASLYAVFMVDMKRGPAARFARVAPGTFALRSWEDDASPAPASEVDQANEADHRVRIPRFPYYSELRRVLPVWDGKPRAQITHLRATLAALRGTPQEPVDWTSPDEWIPERLEGEDRALALAVWQKTGKKVTPRYVYGHWLAACSYGLLAESADGSMHLTDRGRDFVDHPGGATEAFLDEGEGLIKLLALVAEQGPARPGELMAGWGDYLKRRSRFGSESTIKDTLHHRLKNLLERELVSRSSAQYSVTKAGLAYLDRVGDDDAPGDDEHQKLISLANDLRGAVRESVRELLLAMDPYAFEHLVRRLLEAMQYDNVTVTARSNDKGVDVVADIELGITSVREVVQAKRHRRTVQRKDMDALRGSLHRFQAVRGTLITTGSFSSGTRQAAFEPGAAPITLIDGDKLIDLMIEHNIGVRKKTIDVLEVDPDAFAAIEEDAAADTGGRG